MTCDVLATNLTCVHASSIAGTMPAPPFPTQRVDLYRMRAYRIGLVDWVCSLSLCAWFLAIVGSRTMALFLGWEKKKIETSRYSVKCPLAHKNCRSDPIYRNIGTREKAHKSLAAHLFDRERHSEEDVPTWNSALSLITSKYIREKVYSEEAWFYGGQRTTHAVNLEAPNHGWPPPAAAQVTNSEAIRLATERAQDSSPELPNHRCAERGSRSQTPSSPTRPHPALQRERSRSRHRSNERSRNRPDTHAHNGVELRSRARSRSHSPPARPERQGRRRRRRTSRRSRPTTPSRTPRARNRTTAARNASRSQPADAALACNASRSQPANVPQARNASRSQPRDRDATPVADARKRSPSTSASESSSRTFPSEGPAAGPDAEARNPPLATNPHSPSRRCAQHLPCAQRCARRRRDSQLVSRRFVG
jgi:hypothetical protein